MSQLTLSPQTFKWLQSIDLVKQGRRNAQGNIQLDDKISVRFLDGVLISRILMRIIQNQSQINQSLRSKMKSVKQNSTPAIRLYNWNLIVDVLKYYKFSLDYLQKSKILNLETQPVEQLLEYLRGIYYNQNVVRGQFKARGNKNKMNDSTTVVNSSIVNNTNQINQKQQQLKSTSNPTVNSDANKLQIQMKTITIRLPKQANNILQLFTILLSKHFKLSPQQTLNLYLDNNKYLGLLIVKGIKESFQPIISFLGELNSLMEFIVMDLLSTKEKENLQFFFNVIKPCLISNSENVSLKCIQILNQMLDIYLDNNLQLTNILYWLRQQGVNFILKNTNKNDNLFKKSLMFLFKFLQEELFEFIRPVDKCTLWSDDMQKLRFMQIFLVVAQNNLIDCLQLSTCLIQWKNYFIKATKKLKSSQQHYILISILHQTWILFPKMFEKELGSDGNSLCDNFIALLKSNIVSSQFMMFVHCVKVGFELMSVLGKKKDRNAPMFYKMLGNCLQFESEEQRVIFLTENFIMAFDELQRLPGAPLVDPLIQSLSRNPTASTLNLVKHLILRQRLTQEQSIELIEIIMKVMFEDYLLGVVALQIVFETIEFMELETREEFLLRNAMLCLSQFYSLAKMIKKGFLELTAELKKNQSEQQMELNNNNNNNNTINHNYMTQLRRYLLIQNLIKFLQRIIENSQNNYVINQLQQHVFMTYLKVKLQLQKPLVAQILKHMIMKRYYDIQQQLTAVIEQFQRKYKRYLQEMETVRYSKNRKMSIQLGVTPEDQDQSSVIRDNLLQTPNSMFVSQTNTIESPIKLINPFLLKPTNYAIKDLETLKNKLNRVKAQSLNKEKQTQRVEERNSLIKSIINQRRLVKYGAKNTYDIDYKFLFEFQSVKPQQPINGMANVQLTDLQKEEQDIFVDDVQSIMKKYRKVWRFLFFKYSTFGAKQTTGRSPEPKTQQKISMVEVWRMHREYYTDYIKKEESFSIVKGVNERMNRKNDLQNLTYSAFEQYIIQFCIIAYDRLGMTALSPGQKVGKLLTQMKEVTREKGGNVEIFTNPEEVYFQQTDVIKQYNRRLVINPDYILPEGYKKINQTQFIYQNEFTQPSKQACSYQNYLTVLQVLDSIFFQRQELGFHLIEPKTSKIQRTLAKPALFQQLAQKMKNYKEGYLLPKRRQVNSTYFSGRQEEKVNPVIIKPEFHPVMVQFSLGIKLGLSEVPLKYKYIGQQVAYWMDDMLDAIERGLTRVQDKGHKKIQNDAIRNKRRVLHNMKQQLRQKQKLYNQRSQSVRSQFEKIKIIKQEIVKKRVIEVRTKRKEEKLREQMAMKKKLVQFQKAKRFFQQRDEKERQRSKERQQMKRQEKEQYKKKVDEYFKQKKSQLQEKDINLKKERQYELKREKEEEQKRKKFTKKIYLSVLKKDGLALERVEEFKQKYEQFAQEEFVRRQFERNKKSLTLLFQLLLKFEKSKLSTTDSNQISQSTFNFFAVKFNIVPKVLEKNVLGRILVSVWKGSLNKGIGYREFEQTLLRVIVKGKQMLNQMFERRLRKINNNTTINNNNNNNNQSITPLDSSSSRLQNVPVRSSLHESALVIEHESNLKQSRRLDSSLLMSNNSMMMSSKLTINETNIAAQYLFDPEGVTVNTVKQFMLFLNLPDDKQGVEARWKMAIQNKSKQKF